MSKLMFAYGMNTNLEQMAARCPSSKSLGAAVIFDHAFEFKYYATVVQAVGKQVHGVLWEITNSDERSLDILEGYPSYYNKKTVDVEYLGDTVSAMTYIMYPDQMLAKPTNQYFELVAMGYQQHSIPLSQLIAARDRAIKSSNNLVYDQA